MDTTTTIIEWKTQNVISYLQEKFGEEHKEAPLMIIKGKGEDVEEEEDRGKYIVVAESKKKKGKKRSLVTFHNPKATRPRT